MSDHKFGKDEKYPNISAEGKIIGDVMKYMELAMLSRDLDLITARIIDLKNEFKKHYIVKYKN